MKKLKTMNTDTSWANSPIHQMIQNFESPTPETDASEHDINEIPAFPFVSCNFARKLERERDEALKAAEKSKAYKRVLKTENSKLRAQLREEQQLHVLTLNERDAIRFAIRNLRDVKGRFHTEQATHKLFGLLP